MPISIDTVKAEVAERAIRAGAGFVNDVSALRHDPAMAGVVAAAGVPVCLMHMLGEPKTMQHDPRYDDVVAEVAAFLAERVEFARASGIAPDQICIDPGHRLRQDARAQPDAPAPPRPDRRRRAAGAPGRLAQVVPGPADGRARGGPRVRHRGREPRRGAPRRLDAARARGHADAGGAGRRRGDRGAPGERAHRRDPRPARVRPPRRARLRARARPDVRDRRVARAARRRRPRRATTWPTRSTTRPSATASPSSQRAGRTTCSSGSRP